MKTNKMKKRERNEIKTERERERERWEVFGKRKMAVSAKIIIIYMNLLTI